VFAACADRDGKGCNASMTCTRGVCASGIVVVCVRWRWLRRRQDGVRGRQWVPKANLDLQLFHIDVLLPDGRRLRKSTTRWRCRERRRMMESRSFASAPEISGAGTCLEDKACLSRTLLHFRERSNVLKMCTRDGVMAPVARSGGCARAHTEPGSAGIGLDCENPSQ
jgi:hypothetical protein